MDEIVESMDLTAKEVEMILKHRAEQAKITKAKEQTLMLLDYAAVYSLWLLDTGNGSTYSTFCNDCKAIDTTLLEDRNQAYNFIMEIIQLAKNYAANVGTVTYQ